MPEAVSYTIQIDDSSAFSAPLVREQSVTSSIYATSDLATTTQFWRVRGVNSAGVAGAWSAVRSFTPQTAPPPASLSTIDVNPSSVDGGTAAAGTVVMSVGATNGAVVSLSSSNPAVASVPADDHRCAQRLHRYLHHHDVAGRREHAGHDHRELQRSDPHRDPDRHTAGAGGRVAQLTVSPSSVTGGSNTSAVVSLVRRCADWRRDWWSLSSSNPGCCRRSGERHGRRREHRRGLHRHHRRCVEYDLGHDHGQLRRHIGDGDSYRHPGRTSATGERDPDSDGERAEW